MLLFTAGKFSYKQYIYLGFKVLTALVTKSSIFWDITLHSPLKAN
jgi:hypothetical protein